MASGGPLNRGRASRDSSLLRSAHSDDDHSNSKDKPRHVHGKRQLPSVCRPYNSGAGCPDVNCQKLHVCYFWMMDNCRYDGRCIRSHSVKDVVNQCVLSTLGWSRDEVDSVFMNTRDAYMSGRHPDRPTPPQVCLTYSTSECGKDNCRRFHVCHRFISGNCRNSRQCHLSHDLVGGPHNADIIEHLPTMSFRELHKALVDSLAAVDVAPSVCNEYNTAKGCTSKNCLKLHCCKHFILFGECRFGSNCYKAHKLNSFHNLLVLRKFKMDARKVIQLIRHRQEGARVAGGSRSNTDNQNSLAILKERNERLERELYHLRCQKNQHEEIASAEHQRRMAKMLPKRRAKNIK